jgi:cyclophilin family peptidyl-prolyl cis-trans isomerase
MASNHPTVMINTSYGPITLALNPDKAPQTVSNFLSYLDRDFYDGTIFHRVINNFMIQGGGYDANLVPKATQAPIKLESNNGLSNERGTIAMARTNAADSATSQFFINAVDNKFLDYSASNPGYAVFGQVVSGMDVVDSIQSAHTFNVNTSSGILQNLPFPNLVEIFRVERYTQAAADAPLTTHTTSSNAAGVMIAKYDGDRADYGVKAERDGSLSVTLLDGGHRSESVIPDRLVFDDSRWAYDMQGSAGKTALLINAAFGFRALTPDLVGIGLQLFDGGQSLNSVAGMALNTPLWQATAGGTDNAAFVKTVYRNVVGSLPSATEQAHYQGILDRQEMTQTELLTMATETPANAVFIDLIGMAQSGIAYNGY